MRCLRLALTLTLVGALAYASGGVLGWSGTPAGFWAGTVLSFVGPTVGGVLALHSAVRLRGRARWSWAFLGAGALSWASAQATFSFYELVLRTETPFPGPPDVGFVAAAVLVATGAFLYPSVPDRRLSLLRNGLDAALVVLSALLIAWTLVISDVYEAAGTGWLERLLGVTYPSVDVLALSILLLTLRRAPVGGLGAAVTLLGGVLLLLIGDTGFLLLTAADGYQTGNPVDVGWWAGFLLVGIASCAFRDGPAHQADERLRRIAVFLPYGTAASALTVLVSTAVLSRPPTPFEWVLSAATVAVLLARQSVLALDTIAVADSLRVSEDALRHRANHDSLTGLANRTALLEHLDARLAAGTPGEVVLLIDLDGFKAVNDTLGHRAGDLLLQVVARRLQGVVRDEDLVARLGGDEFAVALGPGGDPEQVADRLLATVVAPIEVLDAPVTVTASVGIATAEAGEGADDLLRNADLAMYAAKHEGRDRARHYEPALHRLAQERVVLHAGLREAIDEGHLVLHYQPLVDVTSGQVLGVEALVRWERRGRLVPPGEFLPLAEETGLVVPLGSWVLERACEDLALWREAGAVDLGLAVNVAAKQLAEPGFAARVRAVTERHGLPPRLLTLEITESMLIDGHPQTRRTLTELTDLGVGLALDDFGTGYASLSTLRTVPVSQVKIDRTFVAELEDGPSALVDGIAFLADRLGLDVVAEGVETEVQRSRLARAGIEHAQGYLFARPVPATEVLGQVAQASESAAALIAARSMRC